MAFHSNYGPISYHFRDKARHWSKIAIFFHIPLHSTPPLGGGGSPLEYCRTVWRGYLIVKKVVEHKFTRFDRINERDRQQTDGQTDTARQHGLRYAGVARQKCCCFSKRMSFGSWFVWWTHLLGIGVFPFRWLAIGALVYNPIMRVFWKAADALPCR